MKFEVSNNVDLQEWQQIANQCEYATFFHTPTWFKIFAQTYPNMSIATVKFTFDDAIAIFPMMKISRQVGFWDFPTYISNPAGVYGGWISKQALNQKQSLEIINWVRKNRKNIVWRINPFDNSLLNLTLSKTIKFKEDFTQCLDLNVEHEKLRRNFSRGHKYNIRKAKRNDLNCKIAKTIEEWNEYYKVYQNSLNRWGDKTTSNYPFSLFENAWNSNSKNLKLYLVFKNDKIISGILVLFHNNHSVLWHGATLKEFYHFHPWHFLCDQIIKDAYQHHYKWVDFNPSGGHQGVVSNKKGFGTTKIQTNVFKQESNSYKFVSFLHHKYLKLIKIDEFFS